MRAIDGKELLTRLDKGESINLLDVRGEIEYHTYNIGGINIPLAKLQGIPVGYNKNDEIVVVCKAGLRSATACRILTEKGYLQVRNLTGGLVGLQKLR